MPGFFQLKMKRHGNMITHYSEAGLYEGKSLLLLDFAQGDS